MQTMPMENGPLPEMITHEELKDKIQHCIQELSRSRKKGILLLAEGALRWLTGIRHQVAAIAPDTASPVSAFIKVIPNGLDITFVAAHTELPRIRDRLPEIFREEKNVTLHFAETMPRLDREIAAPGQRDYSRILGAIVRPLIGGFQGNQFNKLKWLSASSTAALVETAHQIQCRMNGVDVRNILQNNLSRRSIETNLILVALKGQEGHYHPLYEDRYVIEENCWVKLVSGSRYSELIVSSSVMVKFGNPLTSEETLRYRALQEAVIEYADCYRDGVSEKYLYSEIYQRFQFIEKKYCLDGFADSAYAHHLGGPTSPLGNRDYLISKEGTNAVFPWMQFAVNPVELRTNTKVEVQGIVLPGAAPFILDNASYTPPGSASFMEITSKNGTTGKVIDIISR